MTSANSKGPSRDWLNLVKSTQAKNKINQWFRNQFKEENIIKGKELLTNYCKTKGINFGDINKPDYQAKYSGNMVSVTGNLCWLLWDMVV